jgi:hypothetical protein
MRNLLLLALLFALPVAIAGEPPATSRVMQLPSGTQVRIYGIGRIAFGDNSHPPSLLVRYESNLEMKDSDALRKEVLQVWELLRPLADKAGDNYAMVMANEPIRGVISHTRRFVYGFERVPGSAWRMREPRKRVK